MALTSEKKGGILAQFRRAPADTGSPEVQVALLSERINGLGEHFTAHKRDHSSRRGLVKMVNQRRKLLDYLRATQPQKYQEFAATGAAPLKTQGPPSPARPLCLCLNRSLSRIEL